MREYAVFRFYELVAPGAEHRLTRILYQKSFLWSRYRFSVDFQKI
jgi:hypothetical protein